MTYLWIFVLLLIGYTLSRGLPKSFFIKHDQYSHSRTYCHIRDIEDRFKKSEIVPANKVHPFRPNGIYHRKIKHIHHFSVKNTPIRFGRESRSHLGITIVEYYSIENGIQYISQCTGKY